MGYFFLGLSFLGAVAPYSFIGQFIMTHGLNMAEFKAQMWATPIGSFMAAAFLIASLVTLIFVFTEGRRLKMKGLWLPLLASIVVGVSCALPLFLYLRSMVINKDASDGEAQVPAVVKR